MIKDDVFLCVSPIKGVMRFDRKAKLSLRYVVPFEILEQVRVVMSRLVPP